MQNLNTTNSNLASQSYCDSTPKGNAGTGACGAIFCALFVVAGGAFASCIKLYKDLQKQSKVIDNLQREKTELKFDLRDLKEKKAEELYDYINKKKKDNPDDEDED